MTVPSYQPGESIARSVPRNASTVGLALDISRTPTNQLWDHLTFIRTWPTPRPWALAVRERLTIAELGRRSALGGDV